MPQAVTHIIIALIAGSLIRDYAVKDKKKFPLHYILILGIAAMLPDIDVAIYWVLHWFGFTLSEVHRTFSHNLFVPLLFLAIAGLTWKLKNKGLGRHHLKLHTIFLMIALGVFIHLVLDATIAGQIMPFYPLSTFSLGNNITAFMPAPLNQLFFPSLDAALIILWLIYIEWKHKISDFI
ncbi:metal-dependent hydrolase [Candidatus Pacearchaeota archaeon]|nr:metal-dependent hydrolase [Candidatus Pacearchaeota archaeon]